MSSEDSLAVASSDILRLIQAHLTEAGLHESCRVLREESGVGMAGVQQSNFYQWATTGQYALLLKSLAVLDRQRAHLSKDLVAEVHEMAILELAEAGDLELAYATYRYVQRELGEALSEESTETNPISRSRLLEQRLAALASARDKDSKAPLPKDYYGRRTKQERRQVMGQQLQDAIPQQPPNRLTSLLQQAIKWQTHTGELPRIRQWWEDEGNENSTSKKKKRKKEFDLVLGVSHVDPQVVGENINVDDIPAEPIPSSPYSTVKFGKKATAEAAVFLPDASGLVTGSSDGLIEIWDPAQKFSELRMDLPYQHKEELLGHDTAISALAVSSDGAMLASGCSDGHVKVWRLDTGKCLRSIHAHKNLSISCVAFSPDASHVLTASHDGTTREFGLRTARMLKEFRGHTSYVNFCTYILSQGASQLLVVTASADGTVRVFDGKTSDSLRVFRPISMGSSLSTAGTSIVADRESDLSAEGGSPTIHSLLPLHTPANTMIIVPRGLRAFLVNYHGAIVRIYQDDGAASSKVFVAATVSSSNRWLYAVKDDGVCCVFDVATGNLENTIANFGSESTSKSKESNALAEITALIHHPTKSILAAFSNDKGQKKGQLVLWK